jgi:hypothetical protein
VIIQDLDIADIYVSLPHDMTLSMHHIVDIPILLERVRVEVE